MAFFNRLVQRKAFNMLTKIEIDSVRQCFVDISCSFSRNPSLDTWVVAFLSLFLICDVFYHDMLTRFLLKATVFGRVSSVQYEVAVGI